MNVVHIRWMIRRDMPDVLAIESRCFDSPWSEDEFIRCLRQRNCIGMVAEIGDRIVGYMIYELHKKRLDILNFAVDPDHQLRGVGRAMIGNLKGKLHPDRRCEISAFVVDNNLDAQLFFKAMGFRATAIIPGFFENAPNCDAYRMSFSVAQHREQSFDRPKSTVGAGDDDDEDELEPWEEDPDAWKGKS